MSGIVAGVQSGGCCCQPQPCQCNDPNRPGAVIDRSLTAVSASWDINVTESWLWNVGQLNGFCGLPCSCVPNANFAVGQYAYRARGNRVRQTIEETCYGCTYTSCAGSNRYYINAQSNGLTLMQTGSYTFTPVSAGPTSLNFGAWNWSGRQVGHCANADPFSSWLYPRVRSYDSFPHIPWDQGAPLSGGIGTDPNGAYCDPVTGSYVSGRWGNTVGPLYAVAYAILSYSPCAYSLLVSIRYLSYAGLMDLANGVFPFDYGRYFRSGSSQTIPPLYEVLYVKECRSIYDTVVGEYVRRPVPPYEAYEQDPLCSNRYERSWEFTSSETAYVS